MKNRIHSQKKRIAIVSYDDNRSQLVEWSYFNRKHLSAHDIISTETTAEVLAGTLNVRVTTLAGKQFGGCRQLAAMIANKEIDILVCIGQQVAENKILTGIKDLCDFATSMDVVVASNEATADFIIKSLPESIGHTGLEMAFHAN